MTKSKLYASLAAASVLLLVTGIPAAFAANDFGTTWIESGLLPEEVDDALFQSVAFGNGTFVAVHDDDLDIKEAFWSSAASVNEWTKATGTDSVTPGGVDVTFGAGTFVSVYYKSAPLYSRDYGKNWAQSDVTVTQSYRDVTFGKDKFVALSNNGTVLISSDGVNWSEKSGEEISGFADFKVYDLVFTGTSFVAVGQQYSMIEGADVYQAAILISPDGLTWTPASELPEVPNNQQAVNAVATDGSGKLVALVSTTSGTTALTSSDHGATWDEEGSFTQDQPLSAGYANGAWFAGGSNYGLMRSTDFGATWNADTNFPDDSSSEGEQTAYSFAFGDGILVSAGYGYPPTEGSEFSPIWFTGTYTPGGGGGGDNGGGGNNNQLANTGSRDNSMVILGSLGLLMVGAAALSHTIRARQQKI